MAKDARLTVRITAELDTWLGVEGEKRGLDKAAFARMLLFEQMSGTSRPPFYETLQALAERPDLPPQETPLNDLEMPAGASEAPDVDEMISAALDTAETSPRRSNEEPAPSHTSGVRSIMRPAVPYSKSLPNWLQR